MGQGLKAEQNYWSNMSKEIPLKNFSSCICLLISKNKTKSTFINWRTGLVTFPRDCSTVDDLFRPGVGTTIHCFCTKIPCLVILKSLK